MNPSEMIAPESIGSLARAARKRWIGPAGLAAILLAAAGCAQMSGNTRPDEGEKNRRVITETYEAFQRGDVEAILAQLDDSIVWNVPGPSTIPFAGRFEGKSGARKFFQAAMGNLRVVEMQVIDSFSHGDRVIVTGYEKMRVGVTGKEYSSRWMHNYRLRNGKVIEFEEFVDTAAQAESFVPNATGVPAR